MDFGHQSIHKSYGDYQVFLSMAKDEHLGGLFRRGMTMEAYSSSYWQNISTPTDDKSERTYNLPCGSSLSENSHIWEVEPHFFVAE